MTFSIRPAQRVNTPLIIGLAGPSKSGKTYSAHRLARGMANGGAVVMINAEGARGHQYADTFQYQALDIDAPYSYERYDEALVQVAALEPACVIIDSVSHAHDGPGGMIEQHDVEVQRRAGGDYKKAERVTWAAWIKPKGDENKFIYRMLSMDCPIILCFRAKEKMKIVAGADPIDLGYQPIASERISFETIFSLMLPPRSKGVPDLKQSDLREPFDTMISGTTAIDEKLGEQLAAWAAGGAKGLKISAAQVKEIAELCKKAGVDTARICRGAGKVASLEDIEASRLDGVMEFLHSKLPEEITDEAVAMRRLEGAQDDGDASAVLEMCQHQAWYPRVVEAYNARFSDAR